MKGLLIEFKPGRWAILQPSKTMAVLPWEEWKMPADLVDKRKIYTEDEAIIRANPMQIVVDDAGVPSIDENWKTNLMSPSDVKVRHHKRLAEQLDAELAKEAPDAIVAIKLQRALDTLKDLTDAEVYQIAKDSLQYADIEKPVIAEKLDAKIDELKLK